MRLVISDPIVVSRGPDSREAGWGVYQFPDLFQLPDGRIMCAFADSGDTIDAYGAERGCYVSSDRGQSWEKARERDFDTVVGIKLENGDRVQFIEPASVRVTEDMQFPKPVAKKGKTNFYRAEEFDTSICPTTWMIHRVSAEHPEGVLEPVKLNWPNMTIRGTDEIVVPPMPWGRLRQAPDGSLWMPDYGVGLNPKNGGFSPYSSNHLFHSTDYGKTWDMVHYMNYCPDTNVYARAFQCEGYGENDITFAPDGSLVRLIRTNGTGACVEGPCYLIRSTDQGKTWSDPMKFDDIGVWPRLCTLKCGVTLASYGRPGFFVRGTEDPACLKWEDRIELVHVAEGENPWKASCSYSDLMALDDHTAGLVYTDFNVLDEKGVPRKTVLFRTITVEE